MSRDIFTHLDLGPDLQPDAPKAPTVTSPMAGLTTTRHADGTRTLMHGTTVLGHYERKGDWRGVTDGGALVRSTTETGVRRAIVEAAL